VPPAGPGKRRASRPGVPAGPATAADGNNITAGHSRGDLYADSTGRLWFCKTGGSTATWHQIA